MLLREQEENIVLRDKAELDILLMTMCTEKPFSISHYCSTYGQKSYPTFPTCAGPKKNSAEKVTFTNRSADYQHILLDVTARVRIRLLTQPTK